MDRRIAAAMFWSLLMLWSGHQSVVALELAKGTLPLRFDPGQTFQWSPDQEIQIQGRVMGENATAVLRIDDLKSGDYVSQFNSERTLPVGSFRWNVGVRGLKTANNRVLDLESLRRVFLFNANKAATVVVDRFEVVDLPRLPNGAKGFSFGALNAPLAHGFVRVAPGDPIIEAGKAIPITRPAPDPLLASGMRGLERIRIPWQEGRVRVTAWTEDPGEWSDLAHPLERTVRVNGSDLLKVHVSATHWVNDHYLRGRLREHGSGDDAWTAFGQFRGGRHSIEVDVAGSEIIVELLGGNAQELFLNALLVEPVGVSGPSAVDHAEAQRAEWYRTNWPIDKVQPAHAIQIGYPISTQVEPLRATTARGAGVRLSFALKSVRTTDKVSVKVTPAAFNGRSLATRLWWGQRRLERRGAGDTVLALTDNVLRADADAISLTTEFERSFELWSDVPAETAAGVYRGSVIFVEADGTEFVLPLEISVLDIVLPKPAKPAGFYLDEAPHLTWFNDLKHLRSRQIDCDLSLMQSFGIDGTAPPLSSPYYTSDHLVSDMASAARHGVTAPWLAYTPAKRLREEYGLARSGERLGKVSADIEALRLVPPIWSVADEPSNPGHGDRKLKDWIGTIREHTPSARVAGHLNAPGDLYFADLFDVVLINHGFGLDRDRVQAAAGKSEVWVYNTARPRLTAGLWLWANPVRRYVQWHARMPTADPYDPTDGREGDVQMILPGPVVCPVQPDIHRHLLELADGLIDQRWLVWLSAQDTADARALSARLRSKLPLRWKDAVLFDRNKLEQVRDAIMLYAIQNR